MESVGQVRNEERALVGMFLLLLAFFVIFMVFAFYTLQNLQTDTGYRATKYVSKNAPIGVVKVDGVIMESESIIKKLHLAEKDDSIKAIIIRINSPGGAVGPTQEIYEEIRRIDQAKKGKPIYASFGSVAASGGYYLGAATRKIYTNAGTVTGSIGVIMNFMDMSELYKFIKLKPEIVKAGRYKDVGSPHRPMNKEEKEIMSSMIAGVHEQFKRDILTTRKDKIKGDLNELAQGQIYSGEQAVELGLADGLKGLYEAGREIHADLKLKADFGLKEIKVIKDFHWGDFLGELDKSVANIKGSFVGRMPMLLAVLE